MSADPIVRLEGGLKVTGQAVFPGETPAIGLLYAALVESPAAAGELTRLDLGAAHSVPGFVSLVTHADAEPLKPSSNTALIRERTIHFAGQPLALVVADSPQAAQAAARAVRLEIAERRAVTAMDQALDQAVAPKLAGRQPAEYARGDAGGALAAAHRVVRHRYVTAVNNHHPMEPHAAICAWDEDRPTVHTCTQAVFGTRAAIAHAFALPPEDIRVVSRYLGGGFGCKGPLWWPWMFWTMLAARRLGRPVKLELSRAQLFTLVGRRQETVQDLALGFDAQARLTAIDHHVVGQTATHGDYVDATANVSRWLYACPNVATTHRFVRTNEPLPVPMRAPGVAPGLFALESALDEAAEAFGLDPVEIRLRNFAERDQQLDRPWSSNGLRECYRLGAERFGWDSRPAPRTARDGRWRLGSGMASACYPAHRQPASARVRISGDAELLVQCGTQDMGSGTYTVLGQMAADVLGVPMACVKVELGDTLLPEGPYSGGSMVTLSLMPAAQAAAEEVRAQIAELAVSDGASPLAGLPPDDLEFADGLVRSKSGNAAEPLVDLMRRLARDGLEAQASAAPPDAPDVTGMGFGAVFVEVGVDPDLGEIRVRRVTAAYAAGRVLNPLLAQSQHIGGLIGGIGMALHERVATDRATGRILGPTFADYLIPTHADMPEFDVILADEHDPHLPGGVKGIGMLGSAGVQAAIANAVYDAVGKRVRHLPIRMEDVL